MLLIISFIERLDISLDSVLIGLFFINKSYELMFGLLFVTILKIIRKFVMTVLYCIRWSQINGKEDISVHLQNLWKLVFTMGFFIAENFMNKFSPSDSIELTLCSSNLKINYKTFMHAYSLIFETVPQLIF